MAVFMKVYTGPMLMKVPVFMMVYRPSVYGGVQAQCSWRCTGPVFMKVYRPSVVVAP